MRLTFNRLLALAAIAVTGLMAGCSTDSPGPTGNPKPGGNGGLSIVLSTTNSTPKAGSCTVIQAFATLNGNAVPDGSSIQFTTLGGFFGQNGNVTVSVITQSGAAFVTLCSDSEGIATVKGKITIGNNSATGTIAIQFTSNGLPQGPFISICANPHFGPVTGGTPITISGGGFGTSTTGVKVLFKSGGITHQGVVTSVTDSTILVISPAFPELQGLGATSVEVDVVLPFSTILVTPNCFTYTSSTSFISICATPGSGPLTGGTPVQIQGGGFGSDLTQVSVSFRIGSTTLPAVVTGVSDTTINVITPAFTGLDATKPNTADIIVKIGAQTTITSTGCFTFTQTGLTPVVSSILPTSGTKLGGTRVTILGSGFSAPVQVFFGTVQAEVVSVNFSQIVAITPPLPLGSSGGLTGVIVPVTVKNAACGTGTNCQSNGNITFTYTVPLTIVSFSPLTGNSDTVVTIFGQGFVDPLQVLFGGKEGRVVSVTGTQILVRPPVGCSDIGGQITVILIATGESATSSSSFTGPPAMTGSIAPSTGPIGVATNVLLTGTGLFPAGNVAALQLKAPATGGTVTILSGADNNGAQTVNLSITPNSGGCITTEFVSFTLVNTVTGCSLDFSFTGTGNGISVSAPVPASGPSGSTTSVKVSGTGLFPTGDSTKLVVNSQSGGTVVITGTTDGTTQVVTLNITPTPLSCAPAPVTFTLKNTTTGCISQTLTFTGNGGITVSAPSPSSGLAGVTTHNVTVTGTGLFPTGDSSQLVVNTQTNGTVIITGTTDGATQTVTFDITPNATSTCNPVVVTFTLKNNASGCVSPTLTFTGTSGGPAVTSGPTPSSGPSGTSTTVTGTNFFRPGFPADATIVNQAGGTVTITNVLQNGDGTQTLVLSISATNTCTGGLVTFQIENTSITGVCKDSATLQFTVNGTGGPTIISGPTPNSGPNASVTHTTVVGTNLFNSGNTANTTIINKAPGGATVTITGFLDNTPSAGQQTLLIDINPAGAACTPVTVTFQIQNANLSAGCRVSPVLTFTGTVVSPVIATGPTPSNVSATATTNVVFTGSNLFPDGNPAAAQVCNSLGTSCGASVTQAGGTVSVFSTSGSNPNQTLTLAITPSGCTVTTLSFTIKNGSCVSGVLSVIVNGIRVDTGPAPSSGDAGVTTTDVTFTGVGFFPTGNPAAVAVINVLNGTAIITSATEGGGVQTVKLSITPSSCTNNVTFQLRNTVTGCNTQQLSFIATEPAAQQPVANFSQTPGVAGSQQVTFNSTSTGPNTPFTCSWVFTGNNAGSPAPPTSSSCGPVLVTWDCGAATTPCTHSPTAALNIKDTCGGASSATQPVSPP